jgi:hypothetical protein
MRPCQGSWPRLSSGGRGLDQTSHVSLGVVETVTEGNSARYSRPCVIVGGESRFDRGHIVLC